MARTSQEYVMFNCENVKLKLFQLEHQLASFTLKLSQSQFSLMVETVNNMMMI